MDRQNDWPIERQMKKEIKSELVKEWANQFKARKLGKNEFKIEHKNQKTNDNEWAMGKRQKQNQSKL